MLRLPDHRQNHCTFSLQLPISPDRLNAIFVDVIWWLFATGQQNYRYLDSLLSIDFTGSMQQLNQNRLNKCEEYFQKSIAGTRMEPCDRSGQLPAHRMRWIVRACRRGESHCHFLGLFLSLCHHNWFTVISLRTTPCPLPSPTCSPPLVCLPAAIRPSTSRPR